MNWFEDFKQFRDKMIKEFEKIFNESIDNDKKVIEYNEPLVYGYSIYVGPDGIPIVKEFGNFKPNQTKRAETPKEFEPYIDTFLDKDNQKIVVTAEIPGVDKEDISVKALENKLFIKSKTAGREFEKTINLGSEVDPNSIKSVYKNGILEVTAEIIKEEDKGFNVEVE